MKRSACTGATAMLFFRKPGSCEQALSVRAQGGPTYCCGECSFAPERRQPDTEDRDYRNRALYQSLQVAMM